MDNISKDKTKKEVPTHLNDVGIRATLNNMGIPNSSIGYNEATNTVTIDGNSFIKPSYYDDVNGITYAPKSAIQSSLVNFYKNSSNPIVRVSDAYSSYAGRYGLDASGLSYDDKTDTVMIGGNPLNTLYTDDSGKSWAFSGDVSNAVKAYANSLNAKNANTISDEYNKPLLDKAENLYYDIKNRDEFSYNPNSDPVYNAYREKYLTEGNRAFEDTLAKLSGNTGGYINSAAVTAATLSNQYYAKLMADKIPELASDAYQRYKSENDTDLTLLSRLISMYDTAYKNAETANNETVKNANSTSKSVVSRYDKANDDYWDDLLNYQDYYWNEVNNNNKLIESNLDNDKKSIENSLLRRLIESEINENDASAYSKYRK